MWIKMNRSITLSRMENLKVENYRQYSTFCISIEGNISLGRKNVGETLGPFAPSSSSSSFSSPSPFPTLPLPISEQLSEWGPGAQHSFYREQLRLHTHVLRGLSDKRPAAVPLHPGRVGGVLSFREKSVSGCRSMLCSSSTFSKSWHFNLELSHFQWYISQWDLNPEKEVSC